MTATNHGKQRLSPSSNTRLRDMFRAGTMLFAVAVAWFAFTPATGVETGLPWDKANHAVAFLTWTMLIGCGWPRAGILTLAAVMLALGTAVELIQGLPAVGRDADVWDVVADMVGSAAGWGLLTAFSLHRALRLRE
jgi:VanZ family protein